MPADSHSEAISSVFEKLFAITNAPEPADSVTRNTLSRLLSAEAEKKESIPKAAKEFTLEDAVMDFGLTYTPILKDLTKHRWKIEALPLDFKTFQPSACLESLLENYIGIYDRSSEGVEAMNFLLCVCIAVIRNKVSTTQSTEDGRRTPTPWNTVKVHCEISFTHTINPMPTTPKTTPKTIVSGRVDHGVGIVIRPKKKVPNRLFHSLLFCVGAKFHGNLNDLAQLVVYLGCLRQFRVNRGRSNTSVYGVATDGLSYVFVTITHEGVLKESRLFNVMDGQLSTVLGCLQYILETAMSMFPNLTSGREALKKSDELGDVPIDLGDSPYLHSNEVRYHF